MASTKSTSKIIGGVLLVAAVVSIFIIRWEPETEPEPPPIRPLKTMTISDSAVRGVRTFPGRVQASQKVDLAFRVSGPLVELPAKAGDPVQEGDLIARIDPRDFEIALANATSQFDEATAALQAMRRGRPEDIEILRANVVKAQAAVDLAEAEHVSTQEVFDQGGATRLELQRTVEERDRRQSELRLTEENLLIGERGARPEDIEATEARIRGLESQRDDAQASLDDSKLIAPFTGLVAYRFVENFQIVQAREPIISLQDVTSIEVIVDLPELFIIEVSQQEPGSYDIVVRFGSIEQSFPLTVKEFSTEADPSTQTFRLVLTMPAPDRTVATILPGMTATVSAYPKMTAGEDQSAFAVPIDAVPIDGLGQYYVWRVNGDAGGALTVHRVDVSVGDMLNVNEIVVLEGIAIGDQIATAGVHFLQEGQQIRLLDEAAGDDES